MTTLLFSQHSSNPLEVASSDPRNRSYHKEYHAARKVNGPRNFTSEDAGDGSAHKDLEDYRDHLAKLYQSSAMKPKPEEVPIMIDLDEGMEREEDINSMDCPQDMCDFDGEEADEDEVEDADIDAQGETDEEMTIHLKPPEEQQEIQLEIANLVAAVPQLSKDYKFVDRLGTGTFSSVYKAIDLWYHTKWDNTPWHGHHPPHSSAHHQSVPYPEGSKVFVAIKRIYVTSNPERIRNEISIMQDCRGTRHTCQLITAFRHKDQVVAVMPYHHNADFREFYRDLPIAGIKAYFRCMFRALRDVHSREIIHRDVKPANFLFDPRTGVGILCDFGLASRIETSTSAHAACFHTPPSRRYPHGKPRSRNEYDSELLKKMQKEARQKSSWPSDRVGYPDKDTRPHSKANRAGTRGFRAPEVLLKCGQQSGAVDVWSAGMILLFFLTGKFPLFQSSDDIEALMEIATIIGRQKMERTALLHSRTFATNVPSITNEGISWSDFVEKQNPSLREVRRPDDQYYPHNVAHRSLHHSQPPPSSSPTSDKFSGSSSPAPVAFPTQESHTRDVENALNLLESLMEPDATRRITPRDALYHPFLADPSEPEDDDLFPHPFGEGVCGKYHYIDKVTKDPYVLVNVDGKESVRRLVAGEGIAIGKDPCEFHSKEIGLQQ
ncbi:kinase-like protein [Pisolithus tinctorius]|nr:kinase-like protein [Pisolithus tinctorius]